MDQINSEIMRQFEAQGLTINEGFAVDARLVKSASHPISNDEIQKLRDKRNTSEGKMVSLLSFAGTWTRTGLSKKTNPITGLKNMPAWISTTALSWLPK